MNQQIVKEIPAYEIQKDQTRKRTLKKSGGKGFIWTVAKYQNASHLGVDERLAFLVEWPFDGYLFYLPAEAGRGLAGIMLYEAGILTGEHGLMLYLLPKDELDFLGDLYRLAEWPELIVDKICEGCGGVMRVNYDFDPFCSARCYQRVKRGIL